MTLVWSVPLPHADKIVLLALADNANDEGFCYPSINTLSGKCGMDERTVRRVIKRLEETGHVTERPRPGRSSTFTVHPGQSARTTPGTVPAGFKSRGSGTQPGPPRAERPDTPGGAPGITIIEPPTEPSLDRGAARAKRSPEVAKRLPDDFGLTDLRRQVAMAEHLDPDREFANFRDHWRSASGAKARKHDWDATWRLWCRRALELQPQRRGAASLDEPTRLRKLMDGRAAIGLSEFRDPRPGETSDQYCKALDDEYKRIERDRERTRPPRFITDLADLKRAPA